MKLRTSQKKRGLGLIYQGGKPMVWGKGAVAGEFVFLSGAEARSDKTSVPVRGIKAQTELALERIKTRLQEAGTSLENVVKFVWYITDRSQERAFYDARDGWLEKNAPKLLKERSYASTLLVVGLARQDMLVEIDCIAHILTTGSVIKNWVQTGQSVSTQLFGRSQEVLSRR